MNILGLIFFFQRDTHWLYKCVRIQSPSLHMGYRLHLNLFRAFFDTGLDPMEIKMDGFEVTCTWTLIDYVVVE